MNKIFFQRIYVKYYVALIILVFSFVSYNAVSGDYTNSGKLSPKLYELTISVGNNKLVNGSDESGEEFRKFFVELAYTPEDMKTGLMYRKEMDDNSGMLFFFSKEDIVRMWMKNTYIPLDMLFIDKKGEIVNFVTNTTPHSLKVVSSVLPVKYVLELNAGIVKSKNIKKGDTVNIKEIIKMHKNDLKEMK